MRLIRDELDGSFELRSETEAEVRVLTALVKTAITGLKIVSYGSNLDLDRHIESVRLETSDGFKPRKKTRRNHQ